MLVVMTLSQHRVSSSKAVRSSNLRDARCMGHAEITCSAVCLVMPHSQFNERVRSHLYIVEGKRSKPVHRRLSLTQDILGKPIPSSLLLALGIKTRNMDVLLEYSLLLL